MKFLNNSWLIGNTLHKRLGPKPHEFCYKEVLFYTKILADTCSIKPSIKSKINYNSFLPNKKENKNTGLLGRIEKEIFDRFNYKIANSAEVFLITRPAQFKVKFNPISFFLIYDNNDLQFILIEVSNTPWNEKVIYPMKITKDDICKNKISVTRDFKKSMHVSPFNNMDQDYKITILIKENNFTCKISLKNSNTDKPHFYADLCLKNVKKLPFLFLLQNFLYPYKVLYRIYYQALKLFFKKNPVFKKIKE